MSRLRETLHSKKRCRLAYAKHSFFDKLTFCRRETTTFPTDPTQIWLARQPEAAQASNLEPIKFSQPQKSSVSSTRNAYVFLDGPPAPLDWIWWKIDPNAFTKREGFAVGIFPN